MCGFDYANYFVSVGCIYVCGFDYAHHFVLDGIMQDINENRSIKDALASEESFFRRNPV